MTQLRRGMLPYCVLASLRGGDQYGLEIVGSLGAVEGMVTSEGTVYPMLSRLRRQGLVETYWQESAAGPPRRYYRITHAGRTAVELFAAEWQRVAAAVQHFLST
jgi:PadR family transcriptional regulator PadR